MPNQTLPCPAQGRVHILNQYIWPDAAPTGIYAEHLADRMTMAGVEAILVGGGGSYRSSVRPKPLAPAVTLRAALGQRGSHVSTMSEYLSVSTAFRDYIRRKVAPGDVVIVTSAPPTSITLHREIAARNATSVYWLQDYYPELLRGVWNYPAIIRKSLKYWWARHLHRWVKVVKSAGNLGYEGPNAQTIRNWPTLEFTESTAPEPKTALYSGNLGYGHDTGAFVAMCERLRNDGYRIAVRGDGPGMTKLPDWIERGPSFASESELREGLLRNEIHLIAAHPSIQEAIFPSKIWNSLAVGRRIECSGFEGTMARELELTMNSKFQNHSDEWVHLIRELLGRKCATLER